ncbi:2'-5' RNA ligase family protein [Actinoplanes sp. NPDC023936]|uniref:2'-5' RNA ligase family protein n=1 Tax=Actinoplanes sp. NPDC023936 TaxID=3154910 RepID=UPI0033FCBBCD
MSLFVAIFPPEDVRRDLASSVPAIRSRADKWHVTLAFLGDADPTLVAPALGRASLGDPFTLRLAGGGRFRSVVWAGLGGDVAALGALRERVVGCLAGFPIDDREFHPHLTVSYRYSASILDGLADYAGPEWWVRGVSLVRSADGTYSRIGEWTLP